MTGITRGGEVTQYNDYPGASENRHAGGFGQPYDMQNNSHLSQDLQSSSEMSYFNPVEYIAKQKSDNLAYQQRESAPHFNQR